MNSGVKTHSCLGHIENGGFLFEGKVKITDDKLKRKPKFLEGVAYIKPSNFCHIEIIEDAKMIIFS